MSTFKEVLTHVVEWLQQDGRVSYLALQLQFNLDDNDLANLKEALAFSHPQACDEDGRGLVWTGDPPAPTQNAQPETERETRFQAVLPLIIDLLQRQHRVPYHVLKYGFGLDEALLSTVRDDLGFRQLAQDEAGKGLLWTSSISPSQHVFPTDSPHEPPRDQPVIVDEPVRSVPEAERRQLTVMFCDLVGSTDLSVKLDPEHLRDVVKAYQETAAEVIHRYEGHIAQYLGDGLLVYFGFPMAHEDDAQRAVYSGLGIPEAIATLNTRLEKDYGVQLTVRIGIHTGPVVVGEMGGGDRHENLALGKTPNIAARLEGVAPSNGIVISPVTAQLVQRSFVLEKLGEYGLKGVSEPMQLYTVVGIREVEYDDHEEILSGGLDALVGRDEEIGLLLRRWEQSKEGQGQVVLISGEAGLGKSSLVEGLRAHVHQEGYTRMAFRCSPYTANSAMHPVIEHVQRVLGWEREDSTETRLAKLEQVLQRTSLLVEEAVPLLAGLLSLPVPADRYPSLTLSPQRQRQLTQDVLVAWMLEKAERQPVLAVWEDLHWADPSTLELLGLLIEQVPTVSMLNVLAYRPEFVPPWPTQSHMTPITLNRLERTHIEALVRRIAGGKRLPTEVQTHIVTKTDGVPLYVEELTKMLLESDLLEEESDQYILTGSLLSTSIPVTLQDSLMARLDSLPTVKEVAQLGAVLGREFDYEMLWALNAIDEPTLQAGLSQLVSHELLYQRGRIPRAKFIFRHVLIRDAAYQSLLRRTRQQYHKRVAELLEAQFPDVVERQPEWVAHHYTEAGLSEPAIRHWHQAGKQASSRSEYAEAIGHLSRGLEVVTTVPEATISMQYELQLQRSLGEAYSAIQGHASCEVAVAYTRARELCEQLGDNAQLAQVLFAQWGAYLVQGDLHKACELGQELLRLAQRLHAPALEVEAHWLWGCALSSLGKLAEGLDHLEHDLPDSAPQHDRLRSRSDVTGTRISAHCFVAWALWCQGYPDQARQRMEETLKLAQDFGHPFLLAVIQGYTTLLYQFRGEVDLVQAHAKATITLAREQGFALWAAWGHTLRGWSLAAQDQETEGVEHMQQGLASYRATGARFHLPWLLPLLIESNGRRGETESALSLVTEGLDVVNLTDGHQWEAELYRLKGELLLHPSHEDLPQAEAALQYALEVACRQQAQSLELRVAMSLSRLWQRQNKPELACELLAPVYNRFTEGFDTSDVRAAKALLDKLGVDLRDRAMPNNSV